MTITMNNIRPLTIEEMKQMVTTTSSLTFTTTSKEETYQWIEDTLFNIRYRKLNKKNRGIVRNYVIKMTGYSSTQTSELIKRFKEKGEIKIKEYARHKFPRTYDVQDIALLATVDEAHGCISGPATRTILERECHVYGQEEFTTLSKISPSHIYNLRDTFLYREKTKRFQKTQARHVSIGERRKPRPDGQPGYVRVDSVHQGDSHFGAKGVYHINLVDEVLQWEIVVCVEKISERFMIPALEAALQHFPFVIHNFHADNGSEYINHQVADLLNRMNIKLTKSRSRKSNDNALVESKNGSRIRKELGYGHIPQKHAGSINEWYQTYYNIYLNYHRPCGFGEEVIVNAKTGKRKRRYPYQDYQTPYDKLKSLPNAKQYLRSGITFEMLDKVAYAMSDTQFALKTKAAKSKLFSAINS